MFVTDKERLEEIKHMAKAIDGDFTAQVFGFDLDGQKIVKDISWLIEQAERLQELEDIIYQDARQAVLEGLYEENKCYREALMNINELWESPREDDIDLAWKMSCVAYKALKEEQKMDVNGILQDEAEYFGSIIQEMNEKLKSMRMFYNFTPTKRNILLIWKN